MVVRLPKRRHVVLAFFLTYERGEQWFYSKRSAQDYQAIVGGTITERYVDITI